MNAGEVFICAGVESMTRVPMGGYNMMPSPVLYQSYPQALISMGDTAENLARQYSLSREVQEAFALDSQRKSYEAQQNGFFDDEIIAIKTDKGGVVSKDGCIRPDSTAEGLAELKPAFNATGSVTAGTSSPLTDGVY